jgi:hypothetical protein
MSGWSLRSRYIPTDAFSPPEDVADDRIMEQQNEQPAAPSASDRDPAHSLQSFETRFQALESTILAIGEQVSRASFPNPPPLPVNPANPGSSPAPADNFPVDRTEHPAIRVRNRRYEQVLSISTYRLRDRTETLRPDQVSNLTTAANQIRPRLEGSFFSADPPLTVLPFLHQLVRVADQSHMSEATLLWVLEDFLLSPVKEAFRSQNLNTWPAAVHWLLVTYAPEQSLDAAMRRLQTQGQSPIETVRQFGLRLQLESASFGSLLSSAEVKSLFGQGIKDPVRSLFAANQPSRELEDSTPLSVLVARAELLETGTRNLPQSSPRTYPRTTQHQSSILLLPHEVESGERPSGETAEILALESSRTTMSSASWTCFVCYKKGHGWLDCPLLAHVSTDEKEAILLRRRAYLEQVRPRSPNSRVPPRTTSSPEPRTGDRISILTRPSSPKNGLRSPRM